MIHGLCPNVLLFFGGSGVRSSVVVDCLMILSAFWPLIVFDLRNICQNVFLSAVTRRTSPSLQSCSIRKADLQVPKVWGICVSSQAPPYCRYLYLSNIDIYGFWFGWWFQLRNLGCFNGSAVHQLKMSFHVSSQSLRGKHEFLFCVFHLLKKMMILS